MCCVSVETNTEREMCNIKDPTVISSFDFSPPLAWWTEPADIPNNPNKLALEADANPCSLNPDEPLPLIFIRL